MSEVPWNNAKSYFNRKRYFKNQVFSKWDWMQEFTVKLCQLYKTTNNLNSVEHQKTYLHWVF